MPAKHQPDFIYLRHVPLRKVHLFTIVQLTCLVLLWVIKTSKAAIVFPMMVLYLYIYMYIYITHIICTHSRSLLLQVLALVFIRKLLDFMFTKRELSWLDDLMPEWKKKKLEDAAEEVQYCDISTMRPPQPSCVPRRVLDSILCLSRRRSTVLLQRRKASCKFHWRDITSKSLLVTGRCSSGTLREGNSEGGKLKIPSSLICLPEL